MTSPGGDTQGAGCRSGAAATCLTLFVLTLAWPAPALAQTCLVTTPIGPGDDIGTVVALQSDGKIVQGGYISNGSNDDFVLVRYDAGLRLDRSFDVDGVVVTPIGTGDDQAEALALQPNGKILLAGFSFNGANNDFAIVRYNGDGSLDTTWGGTGKVVTPIGTGHDEIEGIVVQPDGKVVVAGLTNSGSDNFVVARYNPDGTLDTTGFNSGGCSAGVPGTAISPIGGADAANAVALQADGKIVVAGRVQLANADFLVARYDTNGCIDTTFDTDGWASANFFGGTDIAHEVVVQPGDQKIVLAGQARNGWDLFAVVRFNTNGSLDGTFNPGATLPLVPGEATVDFTPVHDEAYGLALQADGKIVMGGAADWDGGGTNVDLALTRHTTGGTLDTATFNPGGGLPPGAAGKITTDVAANNDWIDALAIQGDGKIVAAGYSAIGTTDDLTLARYNADGSLATDCAVPVYHRSLGMAPDYAIGTVSADTGSAVVTGSGTSWQGQNRGRGDRITIDGTDYAILWVDSNTSLRLTSVFNGVSGTGKAYNIARKFQDPADGKVVVDAWMDCIDGSVACVGVSSGSLVLDNRREVAVVYADGIYEGPLDGRLMQINSVTTDAQHDITVTADGDNRHYGISGGGVQFRLAPTSSGGDVIEVLDRWVTIEWLEIFGDQAGNDALEVTDTATAGGVTVRYLLIHDTGAGIQVQDALADVDLYNNIIHSTSKWGIDIDQPLTGLRIFNNTIYDCADDGVHTVAAGPYDTVLLQNNVVLGTGPPDYDVPGHDTASSNNLSSDGTGTTHSDAGGGVDNLSATASPTVCADPEGCVGFQSITPGSVDLHLRSTTYTNMAVDAGATLSAAMAANDVDTELRPAGAWDVGADELGGTTRVELLSFAATGADSAVDLAWRTGSELDNLGFHLHRALAPSGPWTRITPSLIPGLGSSPEGAGYSFRDTGLTNGILYHYLLEDIDTASSSTVHGPVSAVPQASPSSEGEPGAEELPPPGGTGPPPDAGSPGASGEESPSSEAEPCPTCPQTYGDPDRVSFRVLSRSASGMLVELRTPGFVATPGPAGLHVSVPGLAEPTDAAAPALPLKRALLDGVVGRSARVASVRAGDVLAFPGLTPAAVGEPTIDVDADGIVRAHWVPAALDTSSGGVLPEETVRITSSAFLGETKKLSLEMNPLRYDTATGELLLTRTLTARIAFDGAPSALETGAGSRGRRVPRSLRRGSPDVLAYLHTTDAGLYSVSFDSLFPARQRPIPTSSLKLSLSGEPVPFHVEPSSRLFRSGSRLVFFAAEVASSTDFSAETSHVLEQGRGGVPMGASSAAPSGDPVSLSPLASEGFETNRIYQAGLLQAPDIWLWQGANGGASRTALFSLEGVDLLSSLPARVKVSLQGASDSGTRDEHHVSVSLNGVSLGDQSFEEKLPYVFEELLDASALVEGENTLTLTNLGDTGVYSLVFLDRIEVVFPRVPELKDGRLEGEFTEGGVATVTGAATLAVDVTDPESPVWLSGMESLGGSVRLQAEAGHRYVVASVEGLRAPRVSPPQRSGLRNLANQADYVLIAPEAFLVAAQPLLERRQDQGLSTFAASFEEIAAVFGHGRPSAQALRDFLVYAFHTWQAPSLRYVVLLGDASYDPRNFTGLDQGAPLPAHWTKTSYMWTTSDPTLAAVNGDDSLPDIALGRLPATTAAEAEALVRKVLDWEDSGQSLSGGAVLVADNPDDAGDFEADLEDIRTSFLGGRSTRTLKVRELEENARPQILAAFDAGASFVSYVGHGGAAVWASENVLNSWDTPSLLAQSEQPFMLTMNCLNGYFVAPNYDALAEAFLKVEGRGTIGAFSPSGLSLDGPAHQLHRALMGEITGGAHGRLGDAVLAAQAAYAGTGLMPELLEIYHLLGDPGMRID